MQIKLMNRQITLGERTLIMGILNVTPDSFSDGGAHNVLDLAVKHAEHMIAEGADIIDIGGESTRPNFSPVSVDEELARVIPVVKALAKKDCLLSVDTTKAAVAEAALNAGAHIINDVWGFQSDADMAHVAAKYQAYSVLMHNRNTVDAQADIVSEVKDFLEKSINIAVKAGLNKQLIAVDPGIGFGKTPLQNVELIKRLSELKVLGCPILLGTSRKSTIGKILDLPVTQRVEGTLATTAIGIQNGADIIRVHDVKENLRTAKVADAIVRGTTNWIS